MGEITARRSANGIIYGCSSAVGRCRSGTKKAPTPRRRRVASPHTSGGPLPELKPVRVVR